LYVALDRRYLTQQHFNTLYEQVRLARAKIGAFIKYLAQYESEKKSARRIRQP